MARPKQHGISKVVRRRADGSISHADFYHRSTGAALGRDEAEAVKKAAELDAEVKVELADQSVFEGLVASYYKSSGFARLAPTSKALNRLYISKLERRLGGMPIRGFDRVAVIALREALEGELAEAAKPSPGQKKPYLKRGEEGPMTPTIAKNLVNKLCLLLSHAVDLGIIPANPALRANAQFGVKSRDVVWAEQETARFREHSSGSVRLACEIMLYTAQRLDDVRKLKWERFEERNGRFWFRVRQGKTGVLVDVPAHRELGRELAAVPVERRHGFLVKSPTGLQWQFRNLARAWDTVMAEAGLAGRGLQRRDLRRTAMVRLAEKGATDIQIASVSGHSIEETRKILDTYIPRRGGTALAAIEAWERASPPAA